MNAPTLFGADKRPLAIGKRLGHGGEADVFAISGAADRAVKVYKSDIALSRLDKIVAMIQAGYADRSKFVAFPIEVVKNKLGQFAGFIMARVQEHELIHELYSPGARKVNFPEVYYPFLIRTAANVARAVADVHQSGCVIGDINESGILVSHKATVTLIDADSFQVSNAKQKYLCRVGKPEYTPPELQSAKLDTVIRTTNHDAFGLAVVIFQLLWMGRHPFAGTYQKGDMPVNQAIKEFRFVYSERRSVDMSPPRGVPRLGDFPPQIQSAFEAAFDSRLIRPTAAQWVSLLGELEKNLRRCSVDMLHHYPQASGECPWCRMERALNVQLFLPPSTFQQSHGAPLNTAGGANDIEALWRAIEAISPPPPMSSQPILNSPTLKPSAEARRANAAQWRLRVIGFLLIGISIGIGLSNQALLILAGIGALAGLVIAMRRSSQNKSILERASKIERDWLIALAQWQARADASQFESIKQTLRVMKEQLSGLPLDERRRIDAYTKNRREEQLKNYLDRFLIKHTKIKGVGQQKLVTLTSYGIETAADVSAWAVQNVPGFGPVNSQPLIAWRRAHEARFVYDPNTTQLDRTRTAAIKAETGRRATELREKLADGPRALKRVLAATFQHRSVSDRGLQQRYDAKLQVTADLKLLGLQLPWVHLPATVAPVAGVSAQPARTSTQPGQPTPTPSVVGQGLKCPSCGAVMVMRTARRGARPGRRFWGCTRYPLCRGTRPY